MKTVNAPEDKRTNAELAISFARNAQDMAKRIMEDNPHHVRSRTFMHARFIEREAAAFLNRVLPIGV